MAQLLVSPFPSSAPSGQPASGQPSGGPGAPPAFPASCPLDTIQQEMERHSGGVRRLAVRLRLGLDPTWVWAVLTDYENLHRFIPNLASSRQLWRRGNRVALEQVGTQQFCGLRFSARVEIELEEDPAAGCLRFHMLRGDFRRFEGVWQVCADDSGTTLLYDLTVQGRPGMPIALIEQRLQDDLASNIRGVQQEAQRRSDRMA